MRQMMTESSELTVDFWKAAAEHRLVVPRCNTTGKCFFPPERCIPGTDSTDWDYAESGGHGTVYSYSVVHRPVSPDFEAPYVLAVVDLDEGATMLTNIVDCPPDEVHIDMPVQVTFIDVESGALPVFRPVGE